MQSIWLCILILPAVTLQQTCDSSSDSPQCNEGEICEANTCTKATLCVSTDMCAGGYSCILDYCQPYTCTSTGQCVYDHVCSTISRMRFSQPVCNFQVKPEDIEITWADTIHLGQISGIICTIKKIKPALQPSQLHWRFRGLELDGVITTNETNADGRAYKYSNTLYYYFTEEMEEESITCVGDQGYGYGPNILKTTTIFDIQYQAKPEDIWITGVDTIVEGQLSEITCTIMRIKPALPPSGFYWIFKGLIFDGVIITNETNADGMTYTHINTFAYNFTKEVDVITCAVDPIDKYGVAVFKTATLSIQYAPLGSPTVDLRELEVVEGETAVLTCSVTSMDPGNPICTMYIWYKESELFLTHTQTDMEIVMKDRTVNGNYSCQCSNAHGVSGISDPAQLIVVHPTDSDATMDTSTDTGMIVGVVIACVVIIVIVLVVIYLIKRYDIKIKKKKVPTATLR